MAKLKYVGACCQLDFNAPAEYGGGCFKFSNDGAAVEFPDDLLDHHIIKRMLDSGLMIKVNEVKDSEDKKQQKYRKHAKNK